MYDRRHERVWTKAVTLNAARTLTLHEWLEVVLHEMIHVLDYETNPQHFIGYMRRGYDAHGHWFLEEGEKYTKYGFHVQKYCDADYGMNTSDRKVQGRIDNSVFIFMHNITDPYPMIIKSSRNNLDRNLNSILQRIGKGGTFGKDVHQIILMTSNNPKIAGLKDLRMRDKSSRISWWWYNDQFQEKYGPFQTERIIDVAKAKSKLRVSEDDEGPEEVKPETPEEVIDEIQDNVEGVEDVKEVGQDKFVVTIP